MMRWLPLAPDVAALAHVQERPFELVREGRRIPGLLWLPAQGRAPFPLVLVQHGGSGHKRDDAVLELVEALAGRGLAVAAIDGLLHGDRRTARTGEDHLLQAFLSFWHAGGEREQLVADWLAVMQALAVLPDLAAARIGWCGLSMGTAYGLSVVARSPAIRAAVLGKWSASYPNSAHLLVDARSVSASALFIQHWDDELFDRQGTLDVFTALATPDKRLLVYPGRHAGRTAEELGMVVDFLSGRLCA